MSLFSILKRNSRLALKNNWGRAILVVLIPFALWALIALIQFATLKIIAPKPIVDPTFLMRYGVSEYFFDSLLQTPPADLIIRCVFALLSLLLASPLALGLARWFFALVSGGARPVGEVFHYFESRTLYLRSLWYQVNVGIRCFLWGLLFFALPGGIYGTVLYYITHPDLISEHALSAITMLGVLLSAFLFILAAVFFIATINRYVLTAYLLAEDDGLTVGNALKQSVLLTAGYRFSFMWFYLSFFGWFLLLGAFFLPGLYILPYLETSVAMYARYIIEQGRMEVKNNTDFTKEFVMEKTQNETPDLPPQTQDETLCAPNPFDVFKENNLPDDPGDPQP